MSLKRHLAYQLHSSLQLAVQNICRKRLPALSLSSCCQTKTSTSGDGRSGRPQRPYTHRGRAHMQTRTDTNRHTHTHNTYTSTHIPQPPLTHTHIHVCACTHPPTLKERMRIENREDEQKHEPKWEKAAEISNMSASLNREVVTIHQSDDNECPDLTVKRICDELAR